MKIEATSLDGVLLCTPSVFADARGFFLEQCRTEVFKEIGIPPFVQWNHSRSSRGVLRGIHVQYPHFQGKLVYVPRGAIYDVAVDLRPNSTTYGMWYGTELNDENHAQLWIPEGFGHAFYTCSETADVIYACTDTYYPKEQYSIRYDDPSIGITWPKGTYECSEKDAIAPLLQDTPFARK